MKEGNIKALFITHDYGLYGASQSLQLLLKNNKEIDVTLVVKVKEILTIEKRKRIANQFGIDHKKIKQHFLPWDNCHEEKKTDLRHVTIKRIENFFWMSSKKRLYREIKRGKYDFIHLNSLVLNEIINDCHTFIIHLREVLVNPTPSRMRRISNAKGIIFIDKSVEAPFKSCNLKQHITMNNPINMSGVVDYLDNNQCYSDNIVISLIGRIIHAKGVDFIIRSFKQVKNDNLRLIIVGSDNNFNYTRYCKKLSQNDDRIIFWGEEKEIFKIYAMSDYLIRGDIDFRIGRTILEALYSDCDVIVPSSDKESIYKDRELINFDNKIYHYLPRNSESLKRVFISIGNQKVKKNKFQSNVTEYVNNFNDYIKNVINIETKTDKRYS